MGKGSGTCQTRSSITLSDTISHAAIEHPSRWLEQTSVADLKAGLKAANSYVERMCILHRLKQLEQGSFDQSGLQQYLDDLNQQIESQTHPWFDQLEQLATQQVMSEHLGDSWKQDIYYDYAKSVPEIHNAKHAKDQAYDQALGFENELNRIRSRLANLEQEDLEHEEYDQLREHLETLANQVWEKREDAYDLHSRLTSQFISSIRNCIGNIDSSTGIYTPGKQDLSHLFERACKPHQEQIAIKLEDLKVECVMQLESERDSVKNLMEQSQPVISWVDQELDLQMQDGQIYPLYLKDSLLEDHILYGEKIKPRVCQLDGYNFKINTSSQANQFLKSSMDPDTIQARLGSQYKLSSQDKIQIEKWMYHFHDQYIYPDNALISSKNSELGYEDMEAVFSEIESMSDHDFEPSLRKVMIEQLVSTYNKTADKHIMRSWKDGTEPQSRLRSQVKHQDDEQMVQSLLSAGAKVEHHHIDLPQYKSRHTIESGRKFVLELGDAKLEYVPHSSLGTSYKHQEATTLGWDFSSPEGIKQLELAVKNRYAGKTPEGSGLTIRPRAKKTEDFYIEELITEDGKVITRLKHYLSDNHGFDEIERARNNTYTQVGQNSRKHYYMADPQQIEANSDYRQIMPGQWVTKDEYQSCQERIAQLAEYAAQQKPLKVNLGPDGDLKQAWSRAWKDAGSQSESEQELRLEIEKLCPAPTWARSKQVYARENDPQSAPLSERGYFQITGAEPQAALEIIQQLGLGKLERQIPQGLVPDQGMVKPELDYLHVKNNLKLPKDKMVLHGMTGTNDDQVAERLEKIVQSGGLLSIAERRRRNIHNRSLSPLGDIASGIDGGVPCTIGNQPSHGQGVFFGFKAQVLNRRDVWFSDRDFGACDNRYDKYTDYARSLGQKRIFNPPTKSARQKHLDHGLKRNDNEVYFKHGLCTSEVDTVWYDQKLEDHVLPILIAWSDKFSKNVCFRAYTNSRTPQTPPWVKSLSESISERALITSQAK